MGALVTPDAIIYFNNGRRQVCPCTAQEIVTVKQPGLTGKHHFGHYSRIMLADVFQPFQNQGMLVVGHALHGCRVWVASSRNQRGGSCGFECQKRENLFLVLLQGRLPSFPFGGITSDS
jgi:hypothetical protein